MHKILLAITVLIFSASSGYCHEPKAFLPTVKSSLPLKLTIKSNKPEYKSGEVISLEATIKNVSEKEMIVFWSDERVAGDSGGGGTSLILTPGRLKSYAIYLKPKETIRKSLDFEDIANPILIGQAYTLFYSSQGMVLDFKHRADQEIFMGDLTSNTVTIKVKDKGNAASDPIDRLVARLSNTHGLWGNGATPVLNLPLTATIEQVIAEVFRVTVFERGYVTSYKIKQTKEVRIDVDMPLERYMAVLVQTKLGEKIVLIRYETSGWWGRVYDAVRGY